MKSGTKIFLKIIYYGFTFGIGILLAFVLPGLKYYEKLAYEMEYRLNNEKYSEAMCLIGGYYDENIAYQEAFDDESGIVLFRAATLIDSPTDSKQQYHMHEAYAGFLYCVDDKYLVDRLEDNETVLKVTDADDNIFDIELLNEDTNEDEIYDTITTLKNGGSYVYFEIPKEVTNTISKLEFYDREKKLFKEITVSLNFNHDFYETVKEFIEVYNINSGDSKLNELNDEILKKYVIGSYGDIKSQAETDATIFVLVYFIWIYILGDLLVGRRWIIKFFKWIYRKIRKKKDEPTEEEKDNIYGSDYFTQLVVKVNAPIECISPITISYSNEAYQFSIVLSHDEGYEGKARVHAGSYMNARLECDGYKAIDLPSVLNVRGFKMEIEVNLEKIDEINES